MIHGTRGTGHRWQQRNRVPFQRLWNRPGATSPPATGMTLPQLIKPDSGYQYSSGMSAIKPARPNRKSGGRKSARRRGPVPAAGGVRTHPLQGPLACRRSARTCWLSSVPTLRIRQGRDRGRRRPEAAHNLGVHPVHCHLRRAMLLSKRDPTVLVTHPISGCCCSLPRCLQGSTSSLFRSLVSASRWCGAGLGHCRASITSVCTRSGALPLEPFRRSRWPGRSLRGTDNPLDRI